MINNIINYLLIILAFIFPISTAATNILIALLILLWFIEGDFKEKFNILKKDKIILAIFLIIAFIAFSTILSPQYNQGFFCKHGESTKFNFLIRFIYLGFFYIIFITSAKKETYKIINAFLLSILFSEIVSYAIFFHLIDVHHLKGIGIFYTKTDYLDPSPFMHHSFYSLFLNIAILILIDKLLNEKNSLFFNIFTIIFILSATTNLFINGGRIGQLTFIVSLAIYFINYFKSKIKYIFLSLAFLISVISIAYSFSPIFKNRVNLAQNDIKLLIEKNNFCSSWGARVGMNIAGYNYISQDSKSLIFGKAGVAQKEYLEFTKKNYKDIYKCIYFMHHLHNQYLQILVDGGLLALFSFLLLFYFILKTNTQNISLKYAFVSIFFIASFSDVIFYKTKTYLLFLFVILIIKFYQSKKRIKDEK